MADNFTPNYGWTKPENGASSDTWGTKWNDNADDIDADLKAVSVVANDALTGATGSLKIANKLFELSAVAADARTNIGAQPLNAILTSLAATAGTAGSFPFFSSANTVGLSGISPQGRDLINDATAAAQRSRIGLGNVGNYLVTVSQSGPSGGSDGDVWCLVP